jgi:hypothetical protein
VTTTHSAQLPLHTSCTNPITAVWKRGGTQGRQGGVRKQRGARSTTLKQTKRFKIRLAFANRFSVVKYMGAEATKAFFSSFFENEKTAKTQKK